MFGKSLLPVGGGGWEGNVTGARVCHESAGEVSHSEGFRGFHVQH